MHRTTFESRRQFEQLERSQIVAHQLSRVNSLFERILPDNQFYADKYQQLQGPVGSLDEFRQLPFTTKDELAGNRPEGFSANRSYPLNQYVRFHRTSGTRGQPLVILDTEEDWDWWTDTWQYVLDAAQVTSADRAVMAFSFGPFIGFWSAHDALAMRRALVIPCGGMSTLARIDMILEAGATVLCCTPSYALHLARVARDQDLPIAESDVRVVLVAGEPGGSVNTTRNRIESDWHAQVTDHAGATEVGPWGYGDLAGDGIHVTESEFIAEFISVDTGETAANGELSELVLTTLGRYGAPVIRYRTGDLVRPNWQRDGTNQFVHLDGGVLGRVDDMMIIRGVNVFPSAVERILRGIPEIDEFRLTAVKQGEMDGLTVEVEDQLNDPSRIVEALQLRLGLNVEVRCVELGSLPRFELKGQRFVDTRS